MPLGMEVGLGPGDFVLDGDPVLPPQKKGRSPPMFDTCLLWPNGVGWMDQDGTWHGDRPQPRRLCVKWGPARRINFRSMFIMVIVISLEHCTCVRRYWFVQVQVKF